MGRLGPIGPTPAAGGGGPAAAAAGLNGRNTETFNRDNIGQWSIQAHASQ